MVANKRICLIVLILILFFLSSFTFSHYLFNWDASQFAIGLKTFNVFEHQPHPPGYLAFIFVGKIFNVYFNNANFSLTLISFIFSLLALIYLFLLVSLTFPKRIDLVFIAGWVLITNPIFWFYRSLALTYTVDIFIGVYLAWSYYKTNSHNNRIYFTSIIFGLGAGFRPTLLVLLLPLYLMNVYQARLNFKRQLINLIYLIISVLGWLLPLIILSGGLFDYFQIVKNLFGASSASTSNLFKQIKTVAGVSTVAINFLIVPLLVSLVIFIKKQTYKKIFKHHNFWLFLIWSMPAVMVYVFIHFGQPGYILIFLPVLIILSLYGFDYLLQKKFYFICSLLVVLPVSIFLLLPSSEFSFVNDLFRKVDPWFLRFNYQEIKSNDTTIKQLISDIQKEDGNKLIIATRNLHYYDGGKFTKINPNYFRQIMYYLPEIQQNNIIEIALNRKFSIQGKYENNNYYTIINDGKIITVDSKINKIIILANKLEDHDLPSVNNLISKQNYFTSDISQCNEFKFLDFTFKKVK
ncbi:MAG: hypothetical protein V1898_05100 [Patescibacteria group bacterium]